MLSIGSVRGGPEIESAPIGKLVSRLMDVAADVEEDFKPGPSAALNVVFHIPGSFAPNTGYEGMRDGRFSRSLKLLMIQVSVPKKIVSSRNEERVRQYLFDCLREANRVASKYFKKKGVEYSQPKFLGFVDAVESRF